jgi:hypothetical protein
MDGLVASVSDGMGGGGWRGDGGGVASSKYKVEEKDRWACLITHNWPQPSPFGVG